jgi:hypothetical protein
MRLELGKGSLKRWSLSMEIGLMRWWLSMEINFKGTTSCNSEKEESGEEGHQPRDSL